VIMRFVLLFVVFLFISVRFILALSRSSLSFFLSLFPSLHPSLPHPHTHPPPHTPPLPPPHPPPHTHTHIHTHIHISQAAIGKIIQYISDSFTWHNSTSEQDIGPTLLSVPVRGLLLGHLSLIVSCNIPEHLVPASPSCPEGGYILLFTVKKVCYCALLVKVCHCNLGTFT